jgi:hypothetical protein
MGLSEAVFALPGGLILVVTGVVSWSQVGDTLRELGPDPALPGRHPVIRPPLCGGGRIRLPGRRGRPNQPRAGTALAPHSGRTRGWSNRGPDAGRHRCSTHPCPAAYDPAAAHPQPAAPLRLRPPGQLRIAAAPSVQLDQSARLRGDRTLVRTIHGPDGTALDGGVLARLAGAAVVLPSGPHAEFRDWRGGSGCPAVRLDDPDRNGTMRWRISCRTAPACST